MERRETDHSDAAAGGAAAMVEDEHPALVHARVLLIQWAGDYREGALRIPHDRSPLVSTPFIALPCNTGSAM